MGKKTFEQLSQPVRDLVIEMVCSEIEKWCKDKEIQKEVLDWVTPTPEQELEKIHKKLQELSNLENTEYQRGFLIGRGFEITDRMDQHPEFWDRDCKCAMCMDY